MPTPTYLGNYQNIINIFGYWPSFHDSPVTQFEITDKTLSLSLKVWEMTNDVDVDGYFILTKKHEVSFSFTHIISTNLDSFPPSNILYTLGFSSLEEFKSLGHFSINLDSAMGSDLSGGFKATYGMVTCIKPYSE